MKKIIGITTRVIENEIGSKIDKVPSSLIKKIEDNGGIPLIIPYVDDIKYYINQCDGFVIPGGNTWHKLDEAIIKYAIKENIPLLGICAGMQAIGNIKNFVGTKESDKTIKCDNHYDEEKNFVHSININDGILSDILGTNKIMVNSRHHDMVLNSNDFVIEATSPDGVIEAISIPNTKFLLGVQWHPEDMDTEESNQLFQYFISIC